jgi:ribosomal protein S18 acetylase RimI-like enzyme
MIRPATTADLDLLAPLFDAYRQFYKQDLAAARAYLQARLERGEADVFLETNGLGFALCYCTFSSVVQKPLVILNDLYTTPEARGQGIGTALLEHCQVFAQGTGAGVLRLRTAHDNTTAQRLYEKFGFVKDQVYWTYDLKL